MPGELERDQRCRRCCYWLFVSLITMFARMYCGLVRGGVNIVRMSSIVVGAGRVTGKALLVFAGMFTTVSSV